MNDGMNHGMQSHPLLAAYQDVRQRSLALAAPLSDEDCSAQSMPDASPVKWHLAHTTWFFETFLLEPREAGFVPFDPAFRVLFNSYYNGVGARHPRPRRGLLTRPGMDQVRAYRANVDARMARLLGDSADHADAAHDADAADGATLAALVELGLQHEQQHQELILTDVLHLLAQNPLYPAYDSGAAAAPARPRAAQWTGFDGGVVETGFDGDGFSFDNELPRHRTYLQPFELAAQLVTKGEFLAFVDGGGYRDPALWLSEGWDAVAQNGIDHPLYWVRQDDGWHEFTLHGLRPLDLHAPVTQVSLYEADAYARWAGARLPREAEWEFAASRAQAGTLADLFGSCWQWTASSYAPYPGYVAAAGALGEYNGKFMVNQYVLRGSSCATPPGHARASYRNFFPAGTRWQFSGIRLAR